MKLFLARNLLSLLNALARLRAKGVQPHITYFVATLLALMVITLTGHLGGILSRVESP